MAISVRKFKKDFYKLLDQVAVTGVPIEILHKGKKFIVVREDPPRKLSLRGWIK